MIELKGDWRSLTPPSPKTDKSVLVIRYGGFGDIIQASSIFPQLKRDGYEVWLNVTNNGRPIVASDPNVDEIIFQDREFVSETDLAEYWAFMGANFTRVINLSGVIEGNLLAAPASVDFLLPHKALHRKMNKNYLEAIHEAAGLPFEPAPMFYPTKAEKAWAKSQRNRLGRKNKVVLWSLSGSSVHKLYPYTDYVIANLLQNSDVRFVLVGDYFGKLMERGWEKEPRVWRRSGKWSIRQTMAFVSEADVVVGTETGLLNCAGHMDVPKVCLLSHSSEENLTKHWKNVTALTPEDCPCYPCHKLHTQGFKTCVRDDFTKAAKCMANIGMNRVVDAITDFWRLPE